MPISKSGYRGAGGGNGRSVYLEHIGEWLAGFAPLGPIRTSVLLIYGLCVAVAPFIYKYYLGVLAQGAAPAGSLERQDYDKLRASLAGGNLAARLYAIWLTAFLDQIERFFGDVGLANRTLFLPRFLRLEAPAPLWTAPAFDRCLLLALIYPIVTIFLIWAISGDFGPAEAALGLNAGTPGWERSFLAGAMGLIYFLFWFGLRRRKTRPFWNFASKLVLMAVTSFIMLGLPGVVVSAAGVAVFATTSKSNSAGTLAVNWPLFFAVAVVVRNLNHIRFS